MLWFICILPICDYLRTYVISYPRLMQSKLTKFDIVGPSKVLPRCALPKYLTEELQKHIPGAIFGSNPCRLDLYDNWIALLLIIFSTWKTSASLSLSPNSCLENINVLPSHFRFRWSVPSSFRLIIPVKWYKSWYINQCHKLHLRPFLFFLYTSQWNHMLVSSSSDNLNLWLTAICRIKFYTQEIVIFRQDLLYRMRRSCLIPPSTAETSDYFQHVSFHFSFVLLFCI